MRCDEEYHHLSPAATTLRPCHPHQSPSTPGLPTHLASPHHPHQTWRHETLQACLADTAAGSQAKSRAGWPWGVASHQTATHIGEQFRKHSRKFFFSVFSTPIFSHFLDAFICPFCSHFIHTFWRPLFFSALLDPFSEPLSALSSICSNSSTKIFPVPTL